MKDPAFLFYTKDFQSGTQDMTCEEVGAFLRLLLFQHQHGSIPNDRDRLMRITGIFSVEKFNLVWKMVSLKFNHTDNHLVNQRMADEITTRSSAKPKKIASASLAGLISSNKHLTEEQKSKIKKSFIIDHFIHFSEKEITLKIKEWFTKMVNQMVNNLENEDGNGNEDVIIIEKGKEGTGEKPKPVLPFSSAGFALQWENWKNYLKAQHNFIYLSIESQQAALLNLNTLSSQNEATAIAILHQSMSHGWKGLFELNTTGNAAKPASARKSKAGYSNDFQRKIAERLQSG